ncbi:hypothetical protein GDO86_011071, partial [Hymenochirus boettgeri]
FPDGISFLILVFISVLILFTILGNSFVLLAFIVDKRLRSQSDFILLNLAICDFLIGAFTSPLYIPYMLTGKWILGKFVCKLWLTADYTISTASVFNIVLISYDRYLSVTKTVLYRSLQNKHSTTFLSMGAVWILSFILYGPAVIFWENSFINSNGSVNICVAGFNNIWYVQFGTSCFDFVLPLISISFFNLSIYWNLRRRSRKKSQNFCSQSSKGKEKETTISTIATNSVLASTQLCGTKNSGPSGQKGTMLVHVFCLGSRNTSSEIDSDGRINHMNIQLSNLSRDAKVAKSLSVLVSVFVICWAPCTCLISIRAACRGYCVDPFWYDLTLWMLYLNSTINPILYPFCHKSFKKAFQLILKK